MALVFAAPLLGATASPSIAAAQQIAGVATDDALRYADIADLALNAPIASISTITDAIRLKPEQAPGVPAGKMRFFLTGTVDTLIRGTGGLPGQVTWLADLPLDSRGKSPKPKKSRVILLARPGSRPGELQLVAPDAQLVWSAPLEQRLRAVLAAAVAADAPPVITGVRGAFHVPGALPGESETQIFLATADGRPVSLNVLRRPGETPRWAVALGEIVDESAAPPARDTLLWYRLACGLPARLPVAAGERLSADERRAAEADYALVLAGLGPCARTRVR